MPGKKVRSELKNMIIEESLQLGCVVAGLVRRYEISKNTIYGWCSRCNKSTLSSVMPELQAVSLLNQLCKFRHKHLKFYSQILLKNVSHQSLMELKKDYQTIDFDTIGTVDKAKEKILSYISSIRYDKNDYIFVIDKEGV